MSIRKRTILAILTATMIIVVFEVIHAHTVFLNNYKKLESDEILTDVNHLHAALDSELSDLYALTADWAAWDDTYEFIQNENATYLKSNLVDGTFESLGLNLIIFFDEDGKVIYQKAYDLEEQESIPVSDEITNFFSNNPDLFNLGESESNSGFLAVEDVPTIYCIHPILTSLEEGPIRGYLLFTIIIQDDLFTQIENSVDSRIAFLPFEESIIPEDSKFINLDKSEIGGFYIHEVNQKTVNYFSLINDYQGQSIFVVQQEKNRSIYQQGLKSMRNQMLVILLTSFTAGLLLIITLEKYLLSRLSTLHKAVINYRSNKDKKTPVILPGNDELSQLSFEIDSTLQSLMLTQSQLNGFLEYENLMVDISTMFINLPVNKINNSLQNVLKTIGEYVQADIGLILIFSEDKDITLENIYEWQKPEAKSIKNDFYELNEKIVRWSYRKLVRGELIILSNTDDLPPQAHNERQFLLDRSIHSVICAPLMVGGKLIGAIMYGRVHENKDWDEQTPLLLEIISNIIANAIDRKHNEQQLQNSRQFQYQLNQITKTSIEKDNYNSSIRALSKQLRSLISSDRCWLVLLDKNKTFQVYDSGKKVDFDKNTSAIIKSLFEKTKADIYTYSSGDDPSGKDSENFDLVGKSFIAIPLSAKNQCHGLILLANKGIHNFSAMEKDICQQAATQITLAIMKIRALEESREISKELRDLRTAVVDFSSELELKKLLDTILTRAVKLLQGEGGEFYIYHEDTQELETMSSINLGKDYKGTRIKSGQGAAGKAIELGKIFTLKDYSSWNNRLQAYDEVNIKASMTTPLIVGDRLLGCIAVFHFDPNIFFTKNDQHLLSIFAQHASIAIHNAMLFEKIQKMARIDEVTGLLNRRALNEIGKYEIKRSIRLQRPIAVAMIDLDNYKQINDTCNHIVGDKVLKEIARLFRENVRNIDILGRYGGDECVVIMPETDLENSIRTIERVRSMLENTEIKVDNWKFKVTACFGISVYDNDPPSLEKMIEEADTAMYEAKESGRNCIRIYNNH